MVWLLRPLPLRRGGKGDGMNKPENPWAFPITDKGNCRCAGMTLLDYFATAVMTGLYSDPKFLPTPEDIAQQAYNVAEAMLAEREKRLSI